MNRDQDEYYAAVYQELRAIARRLMLAQKPQHTLQPTALVNEAYLKLARAATVQWHDKTHFLRIAARAMRQVLVNHARDGAAAKRGGNIERVTITNRIEDREERVLEILSLDSALTELAREDSRMAEVVELRVFAGMTAKETAEVLGVSKRTVDNDFRVGKLWLLDALHGGAGAS